MDSGKNEIVYIRALSGFEFEKLCARVIKELGWGKPILTPKIGDGGKDIIVNMDNSGYLFVECKNQPNTNIGRPVIQKLHSAVLAEKATKGIVITTGKFSSEAVQYAENLNVNIKLIDILELTRLAESVGIIIFSGEKLSEHYYKPYPSESGLNKIQFSLFDLVRTYPRKIEDLISFSDLSRSFFTIYYVNYSIHEQFSTSVGVVHKIHKDNFGLYLKGSTGGYIESNLFNFIKPTQMSNLKPISHLHETMNNTETIGENIDLATLSNLAKERIIRENTSTVKYTGKNNVHYSKTCIPSKSSIKVNIIKSISVHYRNVRMTQSSFSKEFISIDGLDSILLDRPIVLCDYCGGKKKLIICDNCSLIVDSGIGKHGKRCSICKKTVCINCIYKHKRPLFIRGYTCKNCSMEIYGEKYIKRKIKRVRKPNYWERIKEKHSFKIN